MVYIRRVKDEVYEKYLAHGKGEKVEVIFRHDRLTSEGYVKVEWKSKDCPQKSLIRIFENKIANAPEAMDEANRFARLFFGMVSEYNRFETTRLDTARFSFNECFVRLMRLLKEAESFEELVAVLVGAFIAQKYGDLETFVQHAYRGTWFLSATILGAYGQRDSLDAQLLQSYEKFFKTYLEKVAIRCQKKFSEGLFIGKEKHGRKILKLVSKERNVTEIAMISYRDGQINIKLETYKKIFPEHWIETALTIETSKSSKLYVISREDVEAFFSLFASLNSVMEVEGLAEILDLTTWFERHESKNCPSIKQLFNVDGGDFQKVFAKMSREYVNLLGRYKNILKEKGYDEHFIVNKIEEKLQCWKDVANFINKYGSQDILQNYLFVVAYLASEIDDKEVLGEILPCLPQRYRSILRTKLVTDSITGRRKVLQ